MTTSNTIVHMDLGNALIAILVMGAITFGTRLFPFAFFRRHQPGPHFRHLQQQLPAMIMLILVVYSVKDTQWGHPAEAGGTIACLAVVMALQWWLRNPLVSIFGGTVLYMVLYSLW